MKVKVIDSLQIQQNILLELKNITELLDYLTLVIEDNINAKKEHPVYLPQITPFPQYPGLTPPSYITNGTTNRPRK